ncbi:GH39 family glycosyl hydrolase [Pseudobutyrivibrio sp.]|uniref:GH39 family glycosyl hydrolase n=1 Tax=Pseudobutyrivibrio sp. TaxID=2014367 RepID=UPI001DCDD5FC|nr:helix-turn-helix domain-containing protein [Pseudobutyrivibrio sp.]MBE5910281.1 helix-turn-helix domain-containing protein [Pseudobutyrivibrio sp.]
MENIREIVQFNIIHESNSEPREQHYHQNLDLLYVLAGSVDVVIDDKVFHLKEEDMILINSNKRHKFENSGNLLAIRFAIDYYLLSQTVGTTQMLFLCNSAVDKNSAYDKLRHQMKEIIRYYYTEGNKDKCYLQALYYQMLHVLIANFMVKTEETRVLFDNDAEKERISEIQSYIQGHYQSAISLNDLAEQMFLTPAYLSKYIKKKFGMTFVDYLNNIRLFHAVDELIYTNKSLTHIAMDNGFCTSAAFNKSFKKVFNVSPGEYRKTAENQNRNNPIEVDDEQGKQQIITYIENDNAKHARLDLNKKSIQADASIYKKKYVDETRVINIGSVYMLLQQEAQEQLLELKEKLGITHVRVWDVFAQNAFIRENGQFSFHKLDNVLDFLVDNKIKLYMEVGQKPTLLMYAPERYINVTATENELFDYEYYKKLIKDLSIHLVNRYGVEEIEKWYFEFWNNPKLNITRENGEYYHYFDMVYNTFKSISPDINIGGPGLILGYEKTMAEEVFAIWKKRDIWPDFVSFGSFQYISFSDGQFTYGKKSLDKDYVKNQVAVMKKCMADEGFNVKEFHLDEWNYTISNRNVISDSCEHAAYIMKNYIDMIGEVDVMCYWHGLDLYAEYYDTNTLLSGDAGLISRDGIKKPSFYAVEFLNRSYYNEIIRCENGIVSTNGRGSYSIVCHNFKPLSEKYLDIEEDSIQIKDIDYYISDTEDLNLNVVLNNVQNGNYQIKTYYINPEYGSVQDLWKGLGLASSMENEEIQFIKQHANPNMERQEIEVSDNKLEIEYVLKATEIRFIEIKYQFKYE